MIYKHDFVLSIDEVYLGTKHYICTKCHTVAIEGANKHYYKIYSKMYDPRKTYFKSSHKQIKIGLKGMKSPKPFPSLIFPFKKANMVYGINPWTGKKMAKLGCLYSNEEAMIKDIL